MDIPVMLKQMCQTISNADLGAIHKARGFPGKGTVSREIFETYYLSSVGVEAALALLSDEEIALLHLLAHLDEEVDIAFFARIYGDESQGKPYYYGTPTQRYRDTFAQVQKNLVRRGILVYAEGALSSAPSKIERWRFRFPPEFARFLPPLIRSPYQSVAPGTEEPEEIRSGLLRDKVLEIVTGAFPSPLRDKTPYRVQLAAGNLKIGDGPFHTGRLLEWQQACWEAQAGMHASDSLPRTFSPLEAVLYTFSQLKEGEWIRPEQLSIPLKVFCHRLKLPKEEEICTGGWQWGCLARLKRDHQVVYRMPGNREDLDPALGTPPHAALQVDQARKDIGVDLHTIPLKDLEWLGRVSNFRVTGGKLLAWPNLVKIGRLSPEERQVPMARWLQAHAPVYAEVFHTVEERWGKHILHQGMLVARVRDLSLKVQIERAFAGRGQLISLAEEWLAFPAGIQAEIEKLVKKSGYVVKTVQSK
jgi:hypothetical protein